MTVQGNRTVDCCVRSYYNVTSMAASARKVAAEIERQPPGEVVVVVGHNGPAGLGRLRHDPCGKDFMPEEGAGLLPITVFLASLLA